MLDKVLIPEIYLPIVYICLAILIYGIIKRFINKVIKNKQESFNKNSYNYKKTETFRVLITNLIKYAIMLLLILSILTVYGVNVTSILAGLGIVGVVAGLALQDFAKDIISGISIILENQYAIGDIISIGDFKGEVVFLGLKTTRIKNWEGQVKIIANRNINEVINYSIENSLAIVDISVSYEDNIEKVETVLKDLTKELTNILPNLTGNVEVLGINALDNSAIVFRIIAPTLSMQHFAIEREIRKQVKLCLDKNKIKIPYPQIEVHNGK